MTQLEQDIQSARRWLVGIGSEIGMAALTNDNRTTAMLDLVALMATLAELPGDMPLRVRLFPNVFGLLA